MRHTGFLPLLISSATSSVVVDLAAKEESHVHRSRPMLAARVIYVAQPENRISYQYLLFYNIEHEV